MRKILFTLFTILLTASAMHAQQPQQLDLELIEETVRNEKEYFNDILNVYLSDDPLIRPDDLALVYYGQSYLPQYNGGNDKLEEELKNHIANGDNSRAYITAKKILEYNPVSLNALFYAWRAAEELGKPQGESDSYAIKYLKLLEMITSYGDGKSSKTAFYVITPDDQDHILYGALNIENTNNRRLDTESLCNIIDVKPNDKFQSNIIYINVSRYLSYISKK